MNAVRSVAGFLVVVTWFAVGCSGSSVSPTSSSSSPVNGQPGVTSDQLSGRWMLTSMQPAGGQEQSVPRGATYSLTFSAGRLSTRADCNTCGGAFALSGQTLTAGPALACTRAACPTMAFENEYTRMLSGDSAVTMSGSTLTLSSPRGVLHFTR